MRHHPQKRSESVTYVPIAASSITLFATVATSKPKTSPPSVLLAADQNRKNKLPTIARKLAKSDPTAIPSFAAPPGVAGAPAVAVPVVVVVRRWPWRKSKVGVGRPDESVSVEVVGRPFEPANVENLGTSYEPVNAEITELLSPRGRTGNEFTDGVTFGTAAVPTLAPVFAGFVTSAETGPVVMIAEWVRLNSSVNTVVFFAVVDEPAFTYDVTVTVVLNPLSQDMSPVFTITGIRTVVSHSTKAEY